LLFLEILQSYDYSVSSFLAIDSACFLKLAKRITLQPLYLHDVIDENQFIEYDEDGLYPEVDAILDSERDQDEHED
jgi:hypothetical protein